jgi:hypothetical protein
MLLSDDLHGEGEGGDGDGDGDGDPGANTVNVIYGRIGNHYEYDPQNVDYEVEWLDATITFQRAVNEGGSPATGLSSSPRCMGGGVPLVGDYSDTLVIFYTVGGSATPGVDHVGLTSGSVTIPSGEWCTDVNFKIMGDKVAEWTFLYDALNDQYVPLYGETIVITLTGYLSTGDWQKEYVLDPETSGETLGGIGDDDWFVPDEAQPSCGCGLEGGGNCDGTLTISSSDLTSEAAGTPWGVTREWTSQASYGPDGRLGRGTVLRQQPYLTWRESPLGGRTLDEIDQQVAAKLAVVLGPAKSTTSMTSTTTASIPPFWTPSRTSLSKSARVSCSHGRTARGMSSTMSGLEFPTSCGASSAPTSTLAAMSS